MSKHWSPPLAVLAAILCSSTALAGQGPLDRLRELAVVETDVMVPMRDGVRLATDIVRPKGDGRYPVVLSRTPYRKNLGDAGMLRLGYAVASQDCRGRFASEGDFYPFIHDLSDGRDTIDWLAKQPWCDGRVAMTGGSYVGFTQLAAAMAQPPALRCIEPTVPPSNFENGTFFFDGALRQELTQGWLLGQSWNSQRVQRNQVPADELARWRPYRDFRAWCLRLPLSDPGPIAVGGPSYAQCWSDLIASWEKPGRWVETSAALRPEQIQVPVLIGAGFFDIFTQENIDLVLALRTRGGGDLARLHSHLVIGPWVHGIGGPAGDLNFPDARAALAGLREKWLARWLKDEKNEVDALPPIRAYLMGQSRWIDTDVWPPAASVPTKLYLAKGTLGPKPPADKQEPSALTYDPDNPVPTIGGNNLMIPKGVRDHRKTAERPDVLTFLGEPLESDLAVVGRLRAHLAVSSSAPDTDFTVMLLDVRPDGYRANIQDGIARVRYRGGRGKPKLMKPGEIVEIEVGLWSTAYTFKKGNRIAVHVSSSNFPRFDRSLNVAASPADWAQPQKAENRVYHDPDHLSWIELPLFPPNP